MTGVIAPKHNVLWLLLCPPERQLGSPARGTEAIILTQKDAALYLSRWHPRDANDGIEFRFQR
jgi:hypothetical protein